MPMIPAFLLILCVVVYRITTGLFIQSGATWLSNFAPFAAIAFCSAVYFPSRYKILVPVLALLISDVVLNFYYNVSMLNPLILCRYLALTLIGCFGLILQGRPSMKKLLSASLLASCTFYLVTNAFSWLTDPGYAKTLAGLVQALTVGLPAFSSTPTWMFFRNSLVSDLLFTVLFVMCIRFGRGAEHARAGAAAPYLA